MTHATVTTGQRGEAVARLYLQQKGFRIEAANWRLGKLGELDLVAFHPLHGILALVEVKTRKTLLHGEPIEAVDARKVAQILALAEAYLAQHPPQVSCQIRFDVIGVYFAGKGRPAEVVHLENAFGTNG